MSQSVTGAKKMQAQAAQPVMHRKCYVRFGPGGVPQLCDRFSGPFATTAGPVWVIGRAY
jgi:hypothetical protein